ncbi:hypothetical protein [Sinorhizobium sp. Sb3]|uniref:hypothetical protein n=1 Tax=Sinorhizobium sp. Sb3 TaxID=1358417 RepID=UPI0007C842A2|nr:hypothetical protein [Sinorhizobium sp. Sb3]
MAKTREDEVQKYLYEVGLSAVIEYSEALETEPIRETYGVALWEVMKSRTIEKLRRLHRLVKDGEFVGSKVRLPISKTRSMELDLLGQHEEGVFVLELKVAGGAERNAFSELLAYSNYIAGMFTMSGYRDITNVLVANLDATITRQAFLYDLLIADRDTIVYTPHFEDGAISSLRLHPYVPSDDEFQRFSSKLLSHESMACAVVTFPDMDGWIYDCGGGELNAETVQHLEMMSSYASQLMEAERLHGFCFARKPHSKQQGSDRNSIFICALNPFRLPVEQRADSLLRQLKPMYRDSFMESPNVGFHKRLLDIAKRVIQDCLPHDYQHSLKTAPWHLVVKSTRLVIDIHNLGFRPTGMLREAYVADLNSKYALDAVGKGYREDFSLLKVNEVMNWVSAWAFMETCGWLYD